MDEQKDRKAQQGPRKLGRSGQGRRGKATPTTPKEKKKPTFVILGDIKKYSGGQGGIERDADDNPYRYSYDADPMLKDKNVVFMKSMAKGGRVGLKSGSKGCKLAMKGKGRAYGKNS